MTTSHDDDAATLKAQQPNATASRRSKAGITDTSVWQLLCTISIVCYSLWGWYLFTFGVSDFRRGSADIQDTCPIAAQLQALDRIVPMGVLRCCLDEDPAHHRQGEGRRPQPQLAQARVLQPVDRGSTSAAGRCRGFGCSAS